MGPRPNKGFVGLKNAGATCYMNSVIQQLYMIPPIRNGILAIEGTGSDVDDDMSGDEKPDNEVFNFSLLNVFNEIYILVLRVWKYTCERIKQSSCIITELVYNQCTCNVLQSNVDPRDEVFSYQHQFDDKPSLGKSEDRKEYNIGVLRHLQVIFGHLASSRLQYYVPRGFWKQFR